MKLRCHDEINKFGSYVHFVLISLISLLKGVRILGKKCNKNGVDILCRYHHQ